MTGIRELSRDQIVSAEAEHVRVSVFGDRTQLDIAIPLDIPIASYLPELAQLVLSRGVPMMPMRTHVRAAKTIGCLGMSIPTLRCLRTLPYDQTR